MEFVTFQEERTFLKKKRERSAAGGDRRQKRKGRKWKSWTGKAKEEKTNAKCKLFCAGKYGNTSLSHAESVCANSAG